MPDTLDSYHLLRNSVVTSTIHSLQLFSGGKIHYVTAYYLRRLTPLEQILLSNLPIVDEVLCDRGHVPVRVPD